MARVTIVGGGTCGVMLATLLEKTNYQVTLVEKLPKLLAKLEASGNGRCNITNNKDNKEFLKHLDNPKYFYPLIKDFGPLQIIDYFTNLGVQLKEEKNNKMYPVSNKSIDIANALTKQLKKTQVLLETKVVKLSKKDDLFKVTLADQSTLESEYLVLAFGGITYPALGSDIKNFKLLDDFDLNIVQLKPQECSINLKQPLDHLMGVSLEDVNIKVKQNDKVMQSLNGDVLFTHFGLSGPGILNTSFIINSLHHENIFISLELLNLDYEKTRKYLLELINSNPIGMIATNLNKVLPKAIVSYIIESLDLTIIKNSNLNKKQITALAHALSDFKMEFKSFYKPEFAFVSSGGIDLKELKAKTLEAKKIPNLYFGGEMLDVCGQLGGYNLTVALSCAYAIAKDLTK